MSTSCLYCGGLKLEPGKIYGYAGPVCHCNPPVVQNNSDLLYKILVALDEIKQILRKR